MKWDVIVGLAGALAVLISAALAALRWMTMRHDAVLTARLEKWRAEIQRSLEAIHESSGRAAAQTAAHLQSLRAEIQQKYAPREELAQLMMGAAALGDALAGVREELRTMSARAAGTRELLLRVERQVDMLQEHVTAREA